MKKVFDAPIGDSDVPSVAWCDPAKRVLGAHHIDDVFQRIRFDSGVEAAVVGYFEFAYHVSGGGR